MISLACGRAAPAQEVSDGSFSVTGLIVSSSVPAVVGVERMMRGRRTLAVHAIDVSPSIRVDARVWQSFTLGLPTEVAAARGITVALPEVHPEIRIGHSPNLGFEHIMAFSMIVVASLMVGLIATAAGLVRGRESGTIEQPAVTPLGTAEIARVKAGPPSLASMALRVPGMVIARASGVPFNGSLKLFLTAPFHSLVASMALGAIVATFSESVQQALLTGFFIVFSLMLLSGTTMPVNSMPYPMQALAWGSPTWYCMEISLGTLLEGVAWVALWSYLTGLAVLAPLITAAAGLRLMRAETPGTRTAVR